MHIKNLAKEYIVITLAILMVAIAFNIFFLPFGMIIGGSSGLAISLNNLLKINPSIIVLVFHILTIILGYIYLGQEEIKKSIYGSFIYPLFIELTSPLKDYIASLNINNNDLLVFIIFGAVISGIASGIIYKQGYTSGGSDILKKIIHKYTGLTIGYANFSLNFVIVVFGSFVLGFDKILYTVLILYINSVSTDKILIGNYSNKIFYIITKHDREVINFINNSLKLKVTELNSVGGYSNTGLKILMCVVSNSDYFKLREGINAIDNKAFFLVTHAHE